MAQNDGYSKLADFMVDQNYLIVRRFRAAAARDLLYLQAELDRIELEFAAIQAQDAAQAGERELYNFDWYLLSTSPAGSPDSQQWAKAMEIRAKLKEYYSSLAAYSNMLEGASPSKRDVATLREWIARPEVGGGIPFSGDDLGPERDTVYDDKYAGDLTIMPFRLTENDSFTRFLAGPAFTLFDRVWQLFKRREPYLVSNILGASLASLAPLMSIIVLYFVEDMKARLSIICVSTLFFSLALTIATRARRIEIFAATAAYASVQVLFVGSVAGKV